MSKRFKWVIGITALGMALVLVASGWHFYHLVRFAKESQETIYEKIIEEAENYLSMSSSQENRMVGYDVEEDLLIYVVDGEMAVHEVEDGVSRQWISHAPAYDIRDTTEWTLEALNREIQKRTQEEYGHGLAVRLAERDSTGRVIHEFQEGRLGKGMACRIEEELGYLERNVLEAEFTVPYGDIWKVVDREAMYFGAFMFFLLFCIFVLFYFLRMEKRNGEIRNLYMRMYRHDLRLPIGRALTWCGALEIKAGERLTEEERECVREAERAVEETSGEVEKMIAVQVCEHTLKVHFREVDIHQLLRGWASAERWPLAEGRKARFEMDFGAENPMVRGERDLLASLFQNLIGNALKYGGEEVTVRLATRERGDGKVEVAVEDNGQGIPAEAVEKVFDKDFRLVRDRKNIKGSGWGLYMVRRIAEAHGGSVRLESEEGRGSRFVVVLCHKKKWIML